MFLRAPLRFPTSSPATYAIHVYLEGSTERGILFIVFSCVFEIVLEHMSFPLSSPLEDPAQQSIAFTVFGDSEGKIGVAERDRERSREIQRDRVAEHI